MRGLRSLSIGLALLAASLASGADLPADAETGLVRTEGFELVRANCTVCHSARIVTATRASRDQWLAMIRWMQETQGLWLFPPRTEATILDYLARHYGVRPGVWRRPPLSPDLLPPPEEAR